MFVCSVEPRLCGSTAVHYAMRRLVFLIGRRFYSADAAGGWRRQRIVCAAVAVVGCAADCCLSFSCLRRSPISRRSKELSIRLHLTSLALFPVCTTRTIDEQTVNSLVEKTALVLDS